MNFQQGKDCFIHPTTTIGNPGFSFTRDKDTLELTRKPHTHQVIIGDNVEIGANTNIDRGSWRDTTIGDGTKIDALVHVGHNTHIGKNCIIVSGVVIGGSSVIGDNCWLGMNSSIKDHTTIGNNVIVGAGAVVLDNVSDGDIVAGVPARSIRSRAKLTSDELFFMAGKHF